MSTRTVQEPVLTAAQVAHILEGVDYGGLSRDEMEHALVTAWNFPVEVDDTDADLRGYLHDLITN